MNHKVALAVATLLTTFAGASYAQAQSCSCGSGVPVNGQALRNLLTGKMVCAKVGNEIWQEQHVSGGALIDYKKGPSDPVDPSTQVGNYAINSNNTVTYTYDGGGGTYTYEVCSVNSGSSYNFCGASFGGRNITGATIRNAGPCP